MTPVSQVPGPFLFALLALTGIVVLLTGVLIFALWRFTRTVRESQRPASDDRSAGTFVAGALQDALVRLRAQERAQQARAEASERLSDAIVTGLSSGLLVVDAAERLRIVNPAGRRMLHLPHLEADLPYRRALASAAPLADVVAEGLASGAPIVRRMVCVQVADAHGSAEPRHLGVSVSPLHDAHTQLHGVICLFTDLTDVVALEQQVRIKDGLAQLGELTAGLAHEFRNGLATIHGYARLLDPAKLPEPFDGYVRALREETDNLGEIVTRFLAFARPVHLSPVPVALRALVDRVVADFAAEAGRLGGAVSVSGEFISVQGDEVLLRQALGNLCRNAIEACAGVNRAPLVEIEGVVDEASATQVIRVADNGPGLRAELRDRVFQPFVTTKSTGSGLGLPLVQKIIVNHNGQIAIGTSPQGGALFEVRLPVAAR